MPVPLHFSFDMFRREIESMNQISRSFMDAGAGSIFQRLETSLEQIQSDGCPRRWDCSEAAPLITKPSRNYEPGGKTAFAVRGEICWTWQISPIRPKGKRNKVSDAFEVNGIASAKLKIKNNENEILAVWRIELGASDSPGCYFHSHLPGELCIPRLASLFVTPMAALEFLLGELFQDRWAEHVSRDCATVQFWRSTQQQLLLKLMDWKRKKIKSSVGSPWIALKKAKPEAADGLFLDRK